MIQVPDRQAGGHPQQGSGGQRGGEIAGQPGLAERTVGVEDRVGRGARGDVRRQPGAKPARPPTPGPGPGPARRSLGRRSLASRPRLPRQPDLGGQDRKSTRLNSSHMSISYAVFCLKKKKKTDDLSSGSETNDTKRNNE